MHKSLYPDMDRQNLLLYLISKAGSVERNKLRSAIYRLNQETGIFPDYTFHARFLAPSDSIMERDVAALLVNRHLDSETAYTGLVGEEHLKISDHGKLYSGFYNIPKKLKSALGSRLEMAEGLMTGCNQMPFSQLLEK